MHEQLKESAEAGLHRVMNRTNWYFFNVHHNFYEYGYFTGSRNNEDRSHVAGMSSIE